MILFKNKEYFEWVENWKNGFSPLNFDCDSFEKAFEVGFKLLLFFDEVEWRFSSSKRGVHFRVLKNGKQLYLKTEKSIYLRMIFGDDLERIAWDLFKYYNNDGPIGRLFDTKNGKRASEWKKLDVKSLLLFFKLSVNEKNYNVYRDGC